MTEPALEPLVDDQAMPHAQRLLACLCAELARSVGGPVCRCCVQHGGVLVPMDVCCDCVDANGQASVQVIRVFPSRKFPVNQIADWEEPCDATVTWVAELSMTVYRCVAVPDEQGRPPSCEDLERDAQRISGDRAAMMRAFACCDWSQGRAKLPGGWTPVPGEGGCGGGFMTVLVDVGKLCCPPAG